MILSTQLPRSRTVLYFSGIALQNEKELLTFFSKISCLLSGWLKLLKMSNQNCCNFYQTFLYKDTSASMNENTVRSSRISLYLIGNGFIHILTKGTLTHGNMELIRGNRGFLKDRIFHKVFICIKIILFKKKKLSFKSLISAFFFTFLTHCGKHDILLNEIQNFVI